MRRPAALLCLLLAAPASGAGLVAERITPENAARLQVGGPDSDGGIGDFALQNGTLCAVIAAPEHEAPISPQGGGLLDLVRCGLANDQWSALVPLVNLSRASVVPVTGLRADQAKAAEENSRLLQEIDALRARLADAQGTGAELDVLREEREAVRQRVAEMLSHLEAI